MDVKEDVKQLRILGQRLGLAHQQAGTNLDTDEEGGAMATWQGREGVTLVREP